MVRRHPFQRSVLDFIRRHQMISPGDQLLVGVSGGPDSMALLHVLKALENVLDIQVLTVAHFEHGLRGEESLDDRDFVVRACAELGIACRVGSEDVRAVARERGISWEMAARFCRHRFFRSLTRGLSVASKIALGHNASDQAEEVLLRLCRGSGPSGLAGMRPMEVSGIVRPLLFATRAHILEYLHGQRLTYRVDSSNLVPVCQRNRIRLEVLPILEEIMKSGVVHCIGRHARLAGDEEDFWNSVVSGEWGRVCQEERGGALRLSRGRLLELHPAIRRRLLRHALQRLNGHLIGVTARHIESIDTLARQGAPGSAIHLPSSLRAGVEDATLILMLEGSLPSSVPAWSEPCWIEGEGEWRWGEKVLRLELLDARPTPAVTNDGAGMDKHRALLDAEAIRWPLRLRTWLPGDRFQPLGLKGHKKLQDFFVDLKVPRAERHSIPILCDTEKICWVVGYRMDDRVKCIPGARRVVRIEVLSANPGE